MSDLQRNHIPCIVAERFGRRDQWSLKWPNSNPAIIKDGLNKKIWRPGWLHSENPKRKGTEYMIVPTLVFVIYSLVLSLVQSCWWWEFKIFRIRLDSVFESVIVIVFKSVFHLEKYVNNFFYFLKIIFEISTSKWFENIKKHINLKQNKNF